MGHMTSLPFVCRALSSHFKNVAKCAIYERYAVLPLRYRLRINPLEARKASFDDAFRRPARSQRSPNEYAWCTSIWVAAEDRPCRHTIDYYFKSQTIFWSFYQNISYIPNNDICFHPLPLHHILLLFFRLKLLVFFD